MKKLKLILILAVLISSFFSCRKPFSCRGTVQLYKFKQAYDYANNVSVGLSEDKKKIISFPSSKIEKPIKLVNNYYLGEEGVNAAYLSITIDEFNDYYEKSPHGFGLDTLYKLLTEKDPYLELYTAEIGIDTATVNNLIRTNNLEDSFTRLK